MTLRNLFITASAIYIRTDSGVSIINSSISTFADVDPMLLPSSLTIRSDSYFADSSSFSSTKDMFLFSSSSLTWINSTTNLDSLTFGDTDIAVLVVLMRLSVLLCLRCHLQKR